MDFNNVVSMALPKKGVKQTTIKAVKFLLAYNSEYFKDLFNSLPSFRSPLSPIEIDVTTPEAFKSVVLYLSYGQVELKNSSVLDILLCTEKFNLLEFQDQCISFISRCCDFEIWFRYWDLVTKFNESNILFNISIIIDTWASNNISEIFADGKISTLKSIHIERVLLTENIKISNENKLLEYLIQWCYYQVTIYNERIDYVKDSFLSYINHIQWNNITQTSLENKQYLEFLLNGQDLVNIKNNLIVSFVRHTRRYDIESLVNNQFEEIKISNKRPRDEDNFIYDDYDEECCYMIKKQKMI